MSRRSGLPSNDGDKSNLPSLNLLSIQPVSARTKKRPRETPYRGQQDGQPSVPMQDDDADNKPYLIMPLQYTDKKVEFLQLNILDYDTGYNMWLNGGVFATSPGGRLIVSTGSDGSLRRAFDFFGESVSRYNAPFYRYVRPSQGASNEFYAIPDQWRFDRPWHNAHLKTIIDTRDGIGAYERTFALSEEIEKRDNVDRIHLGLRYQRYTTGNNEVTPQQSWEEAWLTLNAALKGLAPPVYACGRYLKQNSALLSENQTKHAMYITERGTDFTSWLQAVGAVQETDPYYFVSETVANSLVTQLMKASKEMGLLMTDIKPDNIIITIGSPKVYFIDLDSAFARVDKKGVDNAPASGWRSCFVINSVLLLSHMACDLKNNMPFVIWNTLVEATKNVVRELEGDETDQLYLYLLDVKNKEAKKIIDTEKSKDVMYESLASADDARAVARHIISIARWYMNWSPLDRKNNRENLRVCFELVENKSAWTQLWDYVKKEHVDKQSTL